MAPSSVTPGGTRPEGDIRIAYSNGPLVLVVSEVPLTPTPPGVLIASQCSKTCPKRYLCPHLKCKKFILFKANFLHLKGLENDKYISYEMNMLVKYHLHHLSTEMEGKKFTKVPKITLEITNLSSKI